MPQRNPGNKTAHCLRCGYDWVLFDASKVPKACPGCCSVLWNKPRGWHVKPTEQRFWEKVNKNGPIPAHCPDLGPCWIWTGSLAARYGYIVMSGTYERVRAHRFSYCLHFGSFPDELHVLHKCDRPSCVNPAHLFLGTQSDNIADMRLKDRATDTRGVEHPGAKLTEKQVAAIVKLLPTHTFVEIASLYNVAPPAIFSIAKGRTWSHITGIDPTQPYHRRYHKLSPDDVREIVRTYTLETGPALAQRFGVCLAAIRAIIYGTAWTDVTGIKPRSRYRPRRTNSV